MANLSEMSGRRTRVPKSLPPSWNQLKLTDVCRPRQWPTISKSELTETGYAVYGANGQIGFYSKFTHAESVIAITCRGATCGTIHRIPAFSYLTGNAMALDDLDISTIEQSYLFHALTYRGFADIVSGSAQPQITREGLTPVAIPVPPLPEQKKIAAVLSSVDAAIEKTEAVIAQLQVIKKAMMEQLLTKGMPGRHTRFKQTDLGEIPEEWTIRRIADLGLADTQVVRSGPFGSSLKTKDFLDRGIPVLTIQSLGEGTILRDGLFFISEEKAKELQEYKLLVNDLVFSRVADIGRCAAITTEETGWLISSNLTRVRLDPARASAQLIAEMLTMSPPVRRQIQMLTGSSGRPVISSNMLQQILIPLAPISEQLAISECCNSIQQRISQESSTVNALRSLKSSLSSSLLSGELRVPTDSVPCPV